MLKQFVFATIAAAALGTTASSAHAGGTGWSCRTCGYSNGTSFNGLSRNGLQLEGVAVEQAAADRVVSVIVLPSGEIVSVAAQEAPILAKPKAKPRADYDAVVRDNSVTDSEYRQLH